MDERGPSGIIRPPTGAPGDIFITDDVSAARGPRRCDKLNMIVRGEEAEELKGGLGSDGGWWGIRGDGGADEHKTSNQPSNLCAGLCSLL